MLNGFTQNVICDRPRLGVDALQIHSNHGDGAPERKPQGLDQQRREGDEQRQGVVRCKLTHFVKAKFYHTFEQDAAFRVQGVGSPGAFTLRVN
jgi:hypothetical protein